MNPQRDSSNSRVQLCTKGIGDQYKSIVDPRTEVPNNGANVFWLCESYARLENPAACSLLQPFQIVPSQDRTMDRLFHQVEIAPSRLQQPPVRYTELFVQFCHLKHVSLRIDAKNHLLIALFSIFAEAGATIVRCYPLRR